MEYQVNLSKLWEERLVCLSLFGMSMLLIVKGISIENPLIFPLPVPPLAVYTTDSILVVGGERSATVALINGSDNSLLVTRNISCHEILRLSDTAKDIAHGIYLTSSAPVDVYISTARNLLRVHPVTQLGRRYIFTPFYHGLNQTSESLFVYSLNDSTELEVCSDDFHENNPSNLLRSSIAYNVSSENCFQVKLSFDNRLSFSCLAGIFRLQITSNNPLGILYGLELSKDGNVSSSHVDKEQNGLNDWQYVPPVSTWGNRFVIVPNEQGVNVDLTIIGIENTSVVIKTQQGSQAYIITTYEATRIPIHQESTFSIQANSSILIFIKEMKRTVSSNYFAQPIVFGNGTDKGEPDEMTKILVPNVLQTLTFICKDSNVTIRARNGSIILSNATFIDLFENEWLYVLYYVIQGENITEIEYPKFKCFPMEQGVVIHAGVFERGTITNSSLNTTETIPFHQLDYNGVSMNQTVLSGKETVKISGTVLSEERKLNSSILIGEEPASQNSSENQIKTPIKSKLSLVLRPDSKSDVVDNQIDYEIKGYPSTNHTEYPTVDSSTVSNISRTDSVTPDFVLLKLFNLTRTSTEVYNHKPGLISESSISTTESSETSTVKGITTDTQKKTSVITISDVNRDFKMVLDLFQSEDGRVVNLAEGSSSKDINKAQNILSKDESVPEHNPPYVIDTDIFLNSVTDLDGKSSVAVIISLLSALGAVLVVILIFFLIEVFSRRKYVRNSRIRPSFSYY